MSERRISVSEEAIILSKPGTVARLMGRLFEQDPRAPVRFSSGPGQQFELLSVYTDDKGMVWIDIGSEG